MRAFASSLQMDLEKVETERQFVTKEKNLHGDCYVQYAFIENDNTDYRYLKKSVSHLKDCVNRRYKYFNSLNGYSCNADTNMDRDLTNILEKPETAADFATYMLQSYTPTEPLFSESTSTHTLGHVSGDQYKIEKLSTFGTIRVQPFSVEGATFNTKANTTMYLKEIRAASDSINVDAAESFDNVEYQFKDGDWTWDKEFDLKEREDLLNTEFELDEDQETIKQEFQKHLDAFITEMTTYRTQYYSKDEVDKQHKEGIKRLVFLLTPLNYNSLKSLKDLYFTDNSETGVFKKNIYTEVLSMAGSNPAAVLIMEMVQENGFKSDALSSKAITLVPFNIRRPNKKLVQMYENLLSFAESAEPLTKMAIPLSFARLVRRTCELATPHNYQNVKNENNRYSHLKKECNEQLITPWVQKYFKKFMATDDHELQDHYLMVLYNLRYGNVYELLKDVVFGKTQHKKMYDIRTMAIFAVSPSLLAMGQEKELLPIFLDKYESHEVRIAAFDILMRGPADSTIMNLIIKNMIFEHDREVFNYVYTAFEKYANEYHIPCNGNKQEYAEYFLKFWQQNNWMRPSYGFGVSKTWAKSFAKDKYGYAGTFEFHTTGSHKTASPLSMMFDVRSHQVEHHTLQLFGGYVRIQGLAKKLMDKIRLNTFFQPQQWKVDELKNILFSQMNIRERTEDPVEIDVIFMTKDDVVFQRHYSESSVLPGGNLYNFLMDIVSLGQEYSINQQRGIELGAIIYEQPTEIGIPMAYMSTVMSVISIQAKITRGQDSGALIRTADFKVQMHTQAMNCMSVFNLASPSQFMIMQDRVYNHKFGSKVTAILNPPKRQVKITMERPQYGEPMSMMMHSRTLMSVQENKLNSRNAELRESCPTCEASYVITKGGQNNNDRYFLNVDNEEYGFHAEGKYFDCEADEAKSEGQMFNVINQAFNPMNKHPKDLFTAVTMGFRQLHAFVMFYPKVESCGVGLMWSQSKYNPVEKVEIILNGQMKTIAKDDNWMTGDKFAVDAEVIFHGDVDRVHHVSVKYESEPMMTKNELAVKISRNPFRMNAREYPAFSVCLDYHNRYPHDSREQIKFDFNTDQKVKADLSLSWGYHTSCNNNPGKVQILGEHETTQEGKRNLKTTWYYKICMEQRKSPEWTATAVPYTDACYYTLIDLYTLRHFKWTATFQNLEPWMVKYYRKVETLVRSGLFPFWELDLEHNIKAESDFLYSTHSLKTYSPVVVVEQVFHPQEENFDMIIQNNRGKNVFKGINYGFWEWSSEPYLQTTQTLPFLSGLRNSHMSSLQMVKLSNNLITDCAATTKSLRTFDNVTYSYEMHNCWTLVSAHCGPIPTYAVFIKKSDKFANDISPKMDVKVYIGGHEVNMKPVTHAKFEINIEGQVVSIDEHEAYYWPSNPKMSRSDSAPDNYKFKIYRCYSLIINLIYLK